MLYQDLITRKIIKVLKFRHEASIDRCMSLIPDLIRRYQVPNFLKRDVYFMVLQTYFHGLKEEFVRRLLDEAYPSQEITQTEIDFEKTVIGEAVVYQRRIQKAKEIEIAERERFIPQ